MSNPLVPSEERVLTHDIHTPLYLSIGLSRKQSDKIYFEYKENIVPKCKTVGEAMRMVIDRMDWTPAEKVWCAYNMNKADWEPTIIDKVRAMQIPAMLLGKYEK